MNTISSVRRNDMTIQARNASHGTRFGRRRIDIDFLFLDLNTCARCVGTDQNLEKALSAVEQFLAFVDVEVRLDKILIDSPEKAAAYRFVTCPTIRVNGRDIALETRESKCDSCTDLCGCTEGTNCRVWVYRGQEYTEAPVAMIVEAILEEAFQRRQPAMETTSPYEDVPENLKRFFAGTSVQDGSPCCSASEQQTCCEPAEKAACCGAVSAPQVCGCQ
jgi:Domain of unknown function (DUF2703)